MLITILMMVLAVNGGLYLGTIAYSTYQASDMDKTNDFVTKIHPLSQA